MQSNSASRRGTCRARRITAGAALTLILAASAAFAADAPESFGARILALDREIGHAQHDGVTVYVGDAVDSLLLRRVSLQIDDAAPRVYEYSSDESAALARGGLHRFDTIALAPGAHRLRVELIGRHREALPHTPRVELRADYPFEHSGGVLDIELTAVQEGLRGRARVQLRQWSAASPGPDPHPRVADFLDAIGRPFEAAAERARARSEVPPRAAQERPQVARYNLGVELLRDGRHEEGIAALDALGRIEPLDAEALALRDRANVVLGYQLLRLRRGAEAVPVFQRVRSPGPYGNPALLGLGWAYLMPRGGEAAVEPEAGLWTSSLEDSPALRRRMPFRYNWSVAAGGEREKDLRAALNAWTELNGREAADPAVQEGMLALAYGLGHIGAHEQSQRHNLRAIERLESTRAELAGAIAHVRSGGLASMVFADTPDGWRRQLADLPYDAETAYVRRLAADEHFLDALERNRALHELAAMLAQRRTRLGDAAPDGLRARLDTLEAELRAAMAAERRRMEDVAVAALQTLQRHTESNLAEARFAVARLHDPSPRSLETRPRGVLQ